MEAESLNQTQSSLIYLISLASLLWASPVFTFWGWNYKRAPRLWILGTELRPSGLCSKLFSPLGLPAGPLWKIFIRISQVVSHGDYLTLGSYQRHQRIPVSPHPCPSYSPILCSYLIATGIIYISLGTGDVKHSHVLIGCSLAAFASVSAQVFSHFLELSFCVDLWLLYMLI